MDIKYETYTGFGIDTTSLEISAAYVFRGEYRGFVYNSPTFDLAGLNGLDHVTHRAEPSIAFGWSSDGSTARIAD